MWKQEDNTNPDSEEETFGMRVCSCKNPNKPGYDIAHFFTGEAISTFMIRRKNNIISSSYHVRNKALNFNSEKLKDAIRNTIMGGGRTGISELQWSRLIKSFLEEEV